MKEAYVTSAIVALLLAQSPKVNAQNVAINSSGNPGNGAAILDLSDASNSNLGLAMPNVDLTSIASAGPITSPPAGLIVYNTNTPTTTAGGFGAGFYYWSGSSWNYLYNSGSAAGNNILNQAGTQTNANFNIKSASAGEIGGVIEANGTPTADIFDVDNSSGTPNVYVDMNFQLNAIAGLTVSGSTVNLNNNSNFNTNINTGTSTGAVTIGSGSNSITENGNVCLNNNSGAAVTNIGTGTTSGNVNIGGASDNVILPRFTTNSEILYTSGGNGTLAATTGGSNGNVLTNSSGVPSWTGSSTAVTGGPIGSVLSNSAANTPAWNSTPAANNQVLLSNTAGVPTWTGAGTLVGVKVFTSATYTYTPDAGTNAILVKMVGGGGGGGGAAAATAPGGEGGGGGAGAFCEVYISGVVFTANYYTGTVGVGGAGGANTPAAGSAGAATTFVANATTYTANGGSGGAQGSNASSISNSNAGGAGGAASVLSANMVVSIPGTSGGEGLSNSVVGSVSANTLYVALLSLTISTGNTIVQWGIGSSGIGGNSVFGGEGHSVAGNANAGIAALANTGSGGSGGSALYQGASVSSAGGAGAAGTVIVYEYR